MFETKSALKLTAREVPGYRKGETHIEFHALQAAQPIALIAIDLVARWGMIAGIEDGEDFWGRAKVRLATPEELVKRGVTTAELLVNAIHEKGWVLDVPEPKHAELNGKEE